MRPDTRSYLPFASEASMSPYVPDALTAHGAFYRDHERAYHETVYESGSWGRPLSSQKPGGIYRETSNFVPGAMPLSGSPTDSSYS